jgi:DNA-directed RNA polymerase subunit H
MSEETEKKESMLFDIFKNKLVSAAKIINEEEKKQLLDKYNITKMQLPRILVSDSVSRALKVKPGDVIEFQRNTKLSGLSKYYRIVVGGGI